MARDMTPVLKRCRSLDLDPIYLGIDKKSKKRKKIKRIWNAVERETESEIHLWCT